MSTGRGALGCVWSVRLVVGSFVSLVVFACSAPHPCSIFPGTLLPRLKDSFDALSEQWLRRAMGKMKENCEKIAANGGLNLS